MMSESSWNDGAAERVQPVMLSVAATTTGEPALGGRFEMSGL